MRVPVYNEQMRYDVRQKDGRINGVQYGRDIAFESQKQTGRDLSGLSNALMQASDSVYDTNMKINEADATKALTQYQKEFLAKQTEIQQLKGEQALHASKDFAQWQSQRKQELTKDLSPVAMGMFEKKAGVTFESNRQWVSEYQQQEETRYEDGVFQAHVDTLKDTYLQNINSPKLMRESQDQVFAAIQEFCNRKGLGQEVAKQMYKDFMSKNAMKGIGLHVDNGDLNKARTLLKHSEIYLSADERARMNNIIKKEQEVFNRKAVERQEAQFKNKIASVVSENFDKYGENFTAQQFYEYVDQNIKNPKQRDMAIRTYESEMNYKKKVATANYNAELDKLNTQEFRNLPPREREEQAQQMTQKNWSDEQRATFMKTARGVYGTSTEPDIYAETLGNIQDGNYASLEAFQDFMANNMHRFTKEDADYLTSTMKGIEKENNKLYNEAYKLNEKILLPNKGKEEELDEDEWQENMTAKYAFSSAVRDKENLLGRKMNADELNAFGIEYAKGYTYVRNKDGGMVKTELKKDKDYYEDTFGELIEDFGRFPAAIEKDKKFLERQGVDTTNIDNFKRLYTAPDVYKEIEYMKIDDNIKNKNYDNKLTNNYALNGTLFERGNIDPTQRPVVTGKDGRIETVYSMTIECDGIYYVIPQILRDENGNGYRASKEEAIQEFFKTGKHMGAFTDEINANSYANAYHKEQEKFYTNKKR